MADHPGKHCAVFPYKSLVLVRAGMGKPSQDLLAKMELSDEMPRLTLFDTGLNSEMIDERYFSKLSTTERWIYKHISPSVAQIVAALRRKNDYDVIVTWAEHLGIPLAALLSMLRGRIPHVALFSWISRPKKAILLRLFHSGIDRIILMSSAQRDFAAEKLGIPTEKVILLRWPVDQKFWHPIDSATDTICAVGREMRDYGTLVEAIRGVDVNCHIAANIVKGKKDPWIKRLQDPVLLPPNITVGSKTYGELRALYSRSHFVVVPLFPTDTDNGTTSILEAMSMSKAVICTKVQGQRDVIREGENGLLVPPGDPRALRHAVCHLLDNPRLAQAMGRRGRTLVEEHHSLDQWVCDVQDVVRKAIESRCHTAERA